MKPRTQLWIGRAMSGLFAAFIAIASVLPKFAGIDAAKESMASLGWPGDRLLLLGAIELACLLLYLMPRTTILGAVLMTGLLGGAIASHLRVDSPLLSHTFFGIYLGLLMWGGAWLRDPGLRAWLPFRRDAVAHSNVGDA